MVDPNEWYVVCYAVAWKIEKALPGWREHCLENSRCRVDKVSVFDVVGTEYLVAGKKIFLDWGSIGWLAKDQYCQINVVHMPHMCSHRLRWCTTKYIVGTHLTQHGGNGISI